jgi:hypothetical protein
LEARIYDYKLAIEMSACGEAETSLFDPTTIRQNLADARQKSAIESN